MELMGSDNHVMWDGEGKSLGWNTDLVRWDCCFSGK